MEDLTRLDKVWLGQLTNRDGAGRHFTETYPGYWLNRMERAGWITIHRPIHDATGLPYGEQYWHIEVTPEVGDWFDDSGRLAPVDADWPDGKASDYLTTYAEAPGGLTYRAYQIPWEMATVVCGRAVTSDPEDTAILIRWLLEHGAEEWVTHGLGWVDEAGWGLIGPVIPTTDRVEGGELHGEAGSGSA